MTPQQSHRRAAIMLKHGQDGWIHRRRLNDLIRTSNSQQPWQPANDFVWNWYEWEYCAVRIEKTQVRKPLPIEHYKCGMLVRFHNKESGVVVRESTPCLRVWDFEDPGSKFYHPTSFTGWRWPNETEWRPAYTETVEEREVERLEVGE